MNNTTERQQGENQREIPTNQRELSIRHGEYFFDSSARQAASERARLSPFHRLFSLCFSLSLSRDHLFPPNFLRSTRYEWYSFIPLNLFEQLTPWLKPANFYFLCIAALQSLKAISTTQGRPSILVPLGFVLFVSAVKDAIEDLQRRREDQIKNNARFQILRGGLFVSAFSRDLRVGDLVLVKKDQRIPADLLLVSSQLDSFAFVDTKNLDGETNLKPKKVPLRLIERLRGSQQPDKLAQLDCQITCEQPNGDMREWKGSLSMADGAHEHLSLENLLLADCILRNTAWVLGLVVYCGEESKIRQNMAAQVSKVRYKETSVFRLSKRLFAGLVAIQFLLCLFGALCSGYAEFEDDQSAWYLSASGDPLYYGFLHFWTWLILVQGFVPISLYVSLEVVQFIQARFIQWDQSITLQLGTESFGPSVNTSRLNEELANVSFIFSDKTGTLTQNSMVFRKCVIGKKQFGRGNTEAGIIRQAKASGSDIAQALAQFKKNQLTEQKSEADSGICHVEFDERDRLMEILERSRPMREIMGKEEKTPAKDQTPQLARDFLYALALNNSVFPKVKDEEIQNSRGPPVTSGVPLVGVLVDSVKAAAAIVTGAESTEENQNQGGSENLSSAVLQDPNNSPAIQLDASSPDEAALAAFAVSQGFELFSRSEGRARIRVTDSSTGRKSFEEFEEVCTIEFNSKRKRMTIIVRPIDQDGRPLDSIKIFTKGADSAVRDLLSLDDPNVPDCYKLLEDFGGESLRTLVIAGSEQPLAWFQQFGEKLSAARKSAGPGEKGHIDGNCSSKCALCAVECAIEENAGLRLIGATAIEDKLQEGVPECLAALLEAGLSVWVLTGDNVSTAINIGISCNLLDAGMEIDGRLFVFDKDSDSLEKLEEEIRNAREKIKRIKASASGDGEEIPEFGLALHGNVWKLLMNSVSGSANRRFSLALQRSPDLFRPNTKNSLKKRKSPKNEDEERSAIPLQEVGGSSDSSRVLLDFLDLASQCRSVIACRLEPKEKAEIIEVMRIKTKATCLAIGDGMNDCPMIKQADIGVGIRGVEGGGAVAASDYAISQFRFMTRLLLVHGRLNYRRIAVLINYVFYKSAMVCLTYLYMGTISKFSGQVLYLDWSFQLHNVVYTALPIVIFAIFDRDLEFETLENNPHLYQLTTGFALFNTWLFAQWMILAVIQAALCFYLPCLLFGVTSSPDPNGQSYGLDALGLVIYTCIVIVSNLRLLFVFKSWTKLHHIALWGSIIAFFLAQCLFSASTVFAISGLDYYYVFYRLVKIPSYFLTVLVTVASCLLVDFLWVIGQTILFPSKLRLYEEAEKTGVSIEEMRRNDRQLQKQLESRVQGWQAERERDDSDSKSPLEQPLVESRNDSPSSASASAYTGANFSFTTGMREVFQRSQSSRYEPIKKELD